MSANAHLARLTLHSVIRRRELEVLDARLEDARRASDEVEATWNDRDDRSARPLVPLVATLVSVLAANTALLSGFGIILAGCREPFINALFVLTGLIALVMLPFGGRTWPSTWLRRLAILFLVISVAEVVYAAYELEGVGFPMPT